ncbi:MAG TPA: signal peptidase I [Acidobacteriota bacterium]
MQKSTLREYTESILIAAILALFIRSFVFQAFKIPTGSMEDNLLVGDHILVNKFIYGPTATPLEEWLLPVRPLERQDVIVFRAPQEPDKDFIKRVIGLPGESVVVEGGDVVVDGKPIDDPFANHKASFGSFHDTREPIEVPPGEFFVMGDNRENSRDSRYWGTVPRAYIKGKAMLVYWSYESDEQSYVSTGLADSLRQFGNVILHFFTRTRWERTFQIIR